MKPEQLLQGPVLVKMGVGADMAWLINKKAGGGARKKCRFLSSRIDFAGRKISIVFMKNRIFEEKVGFKMNTCVRHITLFATIRKRREGIL